MAAGGRQGFPDPRNCRGTGLRWGAAQGSPPPPSVGPYHDAASCQVQNLPIPVIVNTVPIDREQSELLEFTFARSACLTKGLRNFLPVTRPAKDSSGSRPSSALGATSVATLPCSIGLVRCVTRNTSAVPPAMAANPPEPLPSRPFATLLRFRWVRTVRLALRPLSAGPSGDRRPVRINLGSPPSRYGATRSKDATSTRIKVQNNTAVSVGIAGPGRAGS